MSKVFAFLFSTVLILLIVFILEGPLTTSGTVPTTHSALAVVADSAGLGTITLPSKHWYSTTKGMTITAVTDGDVSTNASSTVATNRTTVTAGGLTPSSTQNIDVIFLGEDPDDLFGIVMKMLPFILLLGGIGASTAQLVQGGRAGMGEGMNLGFMEAGVVILAGVILLPVVNSFTTLVTGAYTIAPEFLAVTTLTPLVKVAYILGLVGAAFGSIGPSVRGFIGN